MLQGVPEDFHHDYENSLLCASYRMINILAFQFFHLYFFPSTFHSNDISCFWILYIYRTLVSFHWQYNYIFTVFTYGYFFQIFIQKCYIYNAVKYW